MPLRAMLRTKRQRFDAVPTASGGVARAAYRRARKARIAVEPLLKRAGLTMQQAKNAAVRIGVANQIQFLNLVADELRDEFLGFHLAQKIDLRELGPLVLLIDAPKDRCLVVDYSLATNERTEHALYLACKGQLRPR